MDISIILLTKNAGVIFPYLLDCLFSQETQHNYEVLVIDSGSTDNTVNAAKQFPVRLLEIKPHEFSHSLTRNLGAELAYGEVLVFLSQDAMPCSEHWLEKLVQGFSEFPKVAMACGKQVPWPMAKVPERFFYHYYFPDIRLVVTPDTRDHYRDNTFVSNVNSAVSREAWARLRFRGTVAEDKEFAGRALRHGYKIIYKPSASVWHSHDGIVDVFRRYRSYGQSSYGVPRSHGGVLMGKLRYWVAEAEYLRRIGNLRWLPYCLVYDIARYLGSISSTIERRMSC